MKLLTCVLLIVLVAFSALAFDVTGTYSGSFTPEGQDESGAVLHLKQSAGEITGTAGPSEDQQWPIAKGKIDGNKITGEIQHPDGGVLKFDLMVDGEKISGDLTGTMPDGNTLRGKLALTKSKS